MVFTKYLMMGMLFKAGSINYRRIKSLKFYEIRFVIFWLLFLVQNVSSFSRVARYTPSLSCILISKISPKSNKANL